MEIILRAKARTLGRKRYFTGRPCKRGHVAERLVSCQSCIDCSRERYIGTPEHIAAKAKRYRARASLLTAVFYDGPIVPRADAVALGVKRYFTGRPCSRGHVAERITSGYTCVVCSREDAAIERSARPEGPRARNHKHRAANLESERKRGRDQKRSVYQARREEILERNRGWAHRNAGKIIARNRRRRAFKKQVESTLTAAQWEILVTVSQRCFWCKKLFNGKRRPTHDHIIPISKGGGNTLENSCCACANCNFSKRDKLIDPATGQGLLI